MNLEKVKALSPEAYSFLTEATSKNIKEGRYDLSDTVYVNVCSYETKYRKDSVFEAHRKYIDVQYMLNGKEIVTVEKISDMHKGKCLMEYDSDKDAELYEMNLLGTDMLLCTGDVLIFSPEDAHAPGICVNSPETVKKAIVKILVER